MYTFITTSLLCTPMGLMGLPYKQASCKIHMWSQLDHHKLSTNCVNHSWNCPFSTKMNLFTYYRHVISKPYLWYGNHGCQHFLAHANLRYVIPNHISQTTNTPSLLHVREKLENPELIRSIWEGGKRKIMDACHFVNKKLHHLQIRVVSLVMTYFNDFSIQCYYLNYLNNIRIFQTPNPCNPTFFFSKIGLSLEKDSNWTLIKITWLVIFRILSIVIPWA